MKTSYAGAAPVPAGFSLIEMAVVVLVVTLLMGSLLVPLNSQIEQRNQAQTRLRLEEGKEALLSYALTNGRLPCPATAASNGVEAFGAGGDASNGICQQWDGFLPAVTLGLTSTDGNGYAVDGWGLTQNRIRYGVAFTTVNAVTDPFTRIDGMRQATIAELGKVPPAVGYSYLSVCAAAGGITINDCGTSVALANGSAVAVVYSLGKNAAETTTGAVTPAQDEAANLNGDRVYVSRTPSSAAGSEYDDSVEWISVYQAIGRLSAAGRLP